MMDDMRGGVPKLKPPSETGATLLAAGGFAAAFGAASCCTLPMLLGSIGLSSAWLRGVALLAAPHRPMLLIAVVVCLVGGGTLLWRRRTAIACAPGALCGRSMVTGAIIGFLWLGAVLTVLGFVFA
jgi:mercuric ion transport protein